MKRFILSIGISAIILICIVLVMNFAYVRMDNSNSDHTDKFKNVPMGIEICNVGSSHGLNGFSYDDVEGSKTFNFALLAQLPLYDYRILDYYKDHLKKGAVVFIPVSYFSFYGIDEEKREDFENKNKRYYKFLPKDKITAYNKKTAFYTKFPVLTSYDKMANVFLGREGDIDFIWKNKDADDVDINADAKDAYYRHIIKEKIDKKGKRILNGDNMKAIYEMIALCKERGYRPILVTTPFSKEFHREVEKGSPDFKEDFYSKMEELTKNTGVEYYDYSKDKRFYEDHKLFINSDHLNKKGAVKFTNILMDEVLKKKNI